MLPDRAGNVQNWEFDKLVTILLRQFKRLLAERGVELSDKDMQEIGVEVAERRTNPARLQPINDALVDIIAESEGVLGAWKLTFAESLKTEMTDMTNWETTAEFLDVANEKINAEVRISAGSSLMLALGDRRNLAHVIQTIRHDLDTHGKLDVDAMLAKRTATFAYQILDDDPDWWQKLQT